MVDGDSCKACCSDAVDSKTFFSDEEGLNVPCICVEILTVTSEWGEGIRPTSEDVTSPRASWTYVRGLRASGADKDVSRYHCVIVEVQRKISAAGDVVEDFRIEVSGSLACLIGKTVPRPLQKIR